MSKAIEVRQLNVSYNGNRVVKSVDLSIPSGKVTAFIGPSGCGKTTLLRSLNRLSELIAGCRVDGEIYINSENILQVDAMLLRRKIGMVFQKPNPFPISIRENVLYGIKANKHIKQNHDLAVKSSLEKAALWDEVKQRLKDNAYSLSLGQQQRLCIARCLAISPNVILMDEPASSLDPTSTYKLEASIIAMKGEYTVVIVTHNMQQALRIADYTAFFYLGELIEFGETEDVFRNPMKQETKDYVSGRYG
jgi:phosphate transport system ATP-binding protein